MAKFTCPFCLQEYDKKLVKYYCPTCRKTSEATFFEAKSGKVKCKTSGCYGLATHRKCINPNCDAGVNSDGEAVGTDEIPKIALETANLPFCIVGVSNSGKTNFITIMLRELPRAPGLRLVLGAQNNRTQRIQNETYNAMIEMHQAPMGTLPENVYPQVWYIKNMQKKSGNTVPTYTFTIFDGAGESQEVLEAASTEHNYIIASKAIIITLDPLILEGVAHGGMVDPEIRSLSLAGDDQVKNAPEIVNNLATYIRTAKGIRDDKIIPIPVAVVLTKFDTVLNNNYFSADAIVKKSSLTVEGGRINKSEFKQVDGEIRNWLYDIGEGSFVEALEANFKEFCFFGVSSYGAPPPAIRTTPDNIKPHRILDPMLWLFNRFGFID